MRERGRGGGGNRERGEAGIIRKIKATETIQQ